MVAGADPFATGSVPVVPAPVAVVPAPVAVTTAPVAVTTAPVAVTTVSAVGTAVTVAATTVPAVGTAVTVTATTVPAVGTAVTVAATTAPVAGTPAPVAASSGECPAVEKLTVSKVMNESQPTIAAMVLSAIRELSGKNGSSLQAIKKYLAVNYKIDSTKLAPFIGRFLRRAVAKRTLVRTTGSGALGRFKLPDIKQEMVKAVVAKKKKKRVKTARKK
ncbi:unnamed protein product [Macrosiphum euphorbiae]|uniref:H15 domain-containing protein n=1 Tax=Macrosiphum euphorbiae TaxID=13131 RepID=A0AAV0XGR8_9HEMI|nr:unnamed protein product [Macrosiphum euphorbiae]